MFYKSKKSAATVFKTGIPYRVEAVEYRDGMEDGDMVMLKKNGHIHCLPKSAEDRAYRDNYDIIGKYIRTVYGPCEVKDGDMIVAAAGGGRFLVDKSIFEEWYEMEEEVNPP